MNFYKLISEALITSIPKLAIESEPAVRELTQKIGEMKRIKGALQIAYKKVKDPSKKEMILIRIRSLIHQIDSHYYQLLNLLV